MSTQYHSAEQYLGNNRRDAVMITIKVMEVDERKWANWNMNRFSRLWLAYWIVC